jgi:hypothetical protein
MFFRLRFGVHRCGRAALAAKTKEMWVWVTSRLLSNTRALQLLNLIHAVFFNCEYQLLQTLCCN